MTPAFKLLRQRKGHELELQRFCPKRKKNKNQKIMTGISTQFTKGKYFLRFQNNIYYMFFFTLEPRQKLEVVGGSVASKIFFLSFFKKYAQK